MDLLISIIFFRMKVRDKLGWLVLGWGFGYKDMENKKYWVEFEVIGFIIFKFVFLYIYFLGYF